jgi:hypothetical protein
MSVSIGKLRKIVKRDDWKTSARLATVRAVVRHETFADLLRKLMPKSEGWGAFAKRAGISERSLHLFRTQGGKRPYRPTVDKLATALGIPFDRVEAALKAQASRAAVGK